MDLFFVLSGFLIASQFFTRYAVGGRVRWSEFYGKRIFRTLPAYLVVLAIYFLVPQFVERSELPPWWKFVTFTQNLSMELPGKLAFSHAWPVPLSARNSIHKTFVGRCFVLKRRA